MTVTNADTIIEQEIFIDAPAEKIFAALTDPKQLPQWWGGDDDYHIEAMESDLRVGGKWRTFGRGCEGKEFAVHGEYRAIDRPTLLEYTWNYDWDGDAKETVVRFELMAKDGGTLLRLKHSGFHDVAARNDHNDGWKRVLGWLAAYARR